MVRLLFMKGNLFWFKDDKNTFQNTLFCILNFDKLIMIEISQIFMFHCQTFQITRRKIHIKNNVEKMLKKMLK